MNEPLRIPQLTDEQREALEALQARINETIRGIGAAFEAIAQALTNATKGFTAFQDAFALAPPPGTPGPCWRNDPHEPHTWTWRPDDDGFHCPGITEPKEPTS